MKLGVTVKPPANALFSVTVKVISLPSAAIASAVVTPVGSSTSSSVIVPVALSIAVTVSSVPETARLTVKVSSGSLAVSSVVATVKVFSSAAVPAKTSLPVFSV